MKLEDIARKAGVSRSTVSRVINGENSVSERTRQRVMRVIDAEGYIPNSVARMLVTQRSQVIGIIVASLPGFAFDDNHYFPALLRGISAATNQLDYGMLLWMGEDASDSVSFSRRILKNRLMDGLIIASTEMYMSLFDQLLEAGTIFVMVERPIPRYEPHVSYVTVDNVGGAVTAVEHLLKLGRRRIATITGNMNNIDAAERLEGYKQALRHAGIPYDERLAPTGHYVRAGAYRAMQQLLPYRPDAVFVATDQMALGALQALQEAGVRVPDDIALVGFDDLPTAQDAVPSLTTIRQPISERGLRAAELLIDLIEGKLKEPRHIVLPTELVIRETCGGSAGKEGA